MRKKIEIIFDYAQASPT